MPNVNITGKNIIGVMADFKRESESCCFNFEPILGVPGWESWSFGVKIQASASCRENEGINGSYNVLEFKWSWK